MVSRVLTAPLLSPLPGWSTRGIATATGVSQSSVVRVFQRVYDPELAPPQLTRWFAAREIGLTGVHASSENCVLVLRMSGVGDPTRGRAARRTPATSPPAVSARWSLRALLAADLLRSVSRSNGPDARFIRSALALSGGGGARLVLCRQPLSSRAQNELRGRGDVSVEVLSSEQWQSLLTHLERSMDSSPTGRLDALLTRLRAWAHDPSDRFEWLRGSPATTSTVPAPGMSTDSGSTRGQRLASAMTAGIQEAIHSGRLKSGDRVTEAFLTRATHTSRSQVRDALKTLAVDGLVDIEAGRGAVVPEPTTEDVTETYAARRALGGILIQRSISWTPDTIGPVRAAMEALRTAARSRDTWTTGEADLSFQDAIAGSVAMRRIPGMFQRLTVQVRMFLAIMGLDYAYSVDAIVKDDTALLAAITRRDTARALSLWDTKMTAAAQYMTRQLEARSVR
jgi:DNA-binding GntR family transcriptional regulator